MPFDERYIAQVRLLLQVLPLLAEHEVFALKGGTAINLFDRALPRLSVDIDLAYLPINERTVALADVTKRLGVIGKQAKERLKLTRVSEHMNEGAVTRLVLIGNSAQIKVEVSPVLRGSIEPPRKVDVHEEVESMFGFAQAQLVSKADLYAGKFCAALDRQHPRDLFDVAELIENEGLDVVPIEAFLVYLISHNRPFHELIAPNRKELEPAFSNEFRGMARNEVAIDRLISARESLVDWVMNRMTTQHRTFLLSVAKGEPDWSALSVTNAAELPAVKWRVQNIRGMVLARRNETAAHLEKIFT